jgi:purine nucleosidase
MRLHVDTDFAGDPDDACALAMVLGWPDAEVTGVTTVADPDGTRAGYVRYFLDLAGRPDIPVASGAAVSSTTGQAMGSLPEHDRYWPDPVTPHLSPPVAALDLLSRSIASGAAIAAIGPYTNLANLHRAQRGVLKRTRVIAMGGWTGPLDSDLPTWGPDRDWNVQSDTSAALTLLHHADVTWVPIAATARVHLRELDLARLSASGAVGQLLARQARAHGEDRGYQALARCHPGLPDDLQNFHHDPLACAVALGWPGAAVARLRVRPVLDDDRLLRFDPCRDGLPCRMVTAVDGTGFADSWLAAVERVRR